MMTSFLPLSPTDKEGHRVNVVVGNHLIQTFGKPVNVDHFTDERRKNGGTFGFECGFPFVSFEVHFLWWDKNLGDIFQ